MTTHKMKHYYAGEDQDGFECPECGYNLVIPKSIEGFWIWSDRTVINEGDQSAQHKGSNSPRLSLGGPDITPTP